MTLSTVVSVQSFHETRIYYGFGGTALSSVWISQIKSDPSEVTLRYRCVMYDIEPSTVKAQQDRPLFRVYCHACLCNKVSSQSIRLFAGQFFHSSVAEFVTSDDIRLSSGLVRWFRLRSMGPGVSWRREWDLNPRGPKAHRISAPGASGLAIRRHTWLGDPGTVLGVGLNVLINVLRFAACGEYHC